MTDLEDLMIRRPTMDDAELTVALMVRCDIDAYGELDSDLEDLLHEWKEIDLARDAWLAFTPEGGLVGYAAVLTWGKDVRYEFYVDPSWKGVDLGQALLGCCQERGPAFAAERGATGEVTARSFIAHVNGRDREVLEEAGFSPGRYYFQMQIELGQSLPSPEWPTGVSVRSAGEDVDDQLIYALIEAAFTQPERTPNTYDEWKAHMKRDDIYEPELWFLATVGEEIVGACLCFDYPSMGWVRQLGVADGWRRKGIGRALLQHAFGQFKKRGAAKVGLSVESKRPDAHLFYQRVGMSQARQYDEWVKGLGAGD